MSELNQKIMDLKPLPVDLDSIYDKIKQARLVRSEAPWLADLAYRFSPSNTYSWTMPSILLDAVEAEEFLKIHKLLAKNDELSEQEFNDLLVYYDSWHRHSQNSGFNTPHTTVSEHKYVCKEVKFDGSECNTSNQKIAAQLQLKVKSHKCDYLSESKDGTMYLGYKTLPHGRFVKLPAIKDTTPVAISDVIVKEQVASLYPCMKTDEFLNFYRLRFNIIVERRAEAITSNDPLTYSYLVADMFEKLSPSGGVRAGTSPEHILKEIAA